MGARDLLGGVILLAASSQTILANATTAFNFGSPTDIYLPTVAGGTFVSGCRLLLVLSDVRAAGTTSTLGYTVQDAPDLAGAIDTGNLGTALVDGSSLTGTAAAAHRKVVGVAVQTGRPWLRVNAVHGGGGTDSYQCHATLLAVPGGL
jgi:antirestriction protein ArdC